MCPMLQTHHERALTLAGVPHRSARFDVVFGQQLLIGRGTTFPFFFLVRVSKQGP